MNDKSGRRYRRASFVVVLATALAAVLVGTACGGGGDQTKEVENTIRASADKLAANDVDGFLATYTDQGISEAFAEVGPDVDRAAVKQELEGQHETFAVRSFENTSITGDAASTDVELSFGKFVQVRHQTLVRQAGAWKIDGSTISTTPIPSGAEKVHVNLNEFAFDTGEADLSSGNIAFEATNAGQQTHELVAVKIPDDAVLEELLQQENPQGVEVLGGADVQPGETKNFVFVEDLAPGHYVLVCFLPDTSGDGMPHAMKGMTKEFRID